VKTLCTIVCFVSAVAACVAQWQHAPIDTVFAFMPGTGQNAGQGPGVFPSNILGLPSRDARDDVPENDPSEVCSIGLRGQIMVGWKGGVVVDGPGADITIFENAFHYSNGKLYGEPARVEFSRDGVSWIAVPFDSVTFNGCAGLVPTYGDKDPWDPFVSGGTAFDLASVGIDSVRFVRLTDVTAMLMAQPLNPLYDPTLTGFDLDAVLGLHMVPSPISSTMGYDEVSHIASVTVRVEDVRNGAASLDAYQTDGTWVWTRALPAGYHTIDMSGLPHGCSFLVFRTNGAATTMKVLR
jgi:hypothetical protein